jgi:hypothetical protein
VVIVSDLDMGVELAGVSAEVCAWDVVMTHSQYTISTLLALPLLKEVTNISHRHKFLAMSLDSSSLRLFYT